MVNVYMNPENLEKRIAGLEEYAQSAIEAQATVHCMYLNDPIKTGESLGSLESAVFKAATEIKSHAEELKRCKTTMVNLNSNGVASHDLEGGISIEVPDDSAGLETTDKFQKWAQGATDAHDLKNRSYASGPGGEVESTPSGRKIDEIRESMAANQNDPTYANSIVDNIGLENMLKYPARDLLGSALATASQTWSKEKSEKNAELLTKPLGKRSQGREFNELIGGHDTDGDNVTDLRFGTDFLVSLGKKTEEVKPTEFGDPLEAVLEAMVPNEEAARAFLTPRGGDANDVERVNTLINRNPIGNNAWTDAWTGLSSYTAEAHGIDSYDATTKSPESKQAAAITTGVVNRIGGELKSKGTSCQISGAARSRLSYALSRFPYAVDIAANRPANPDNYDPEVPDAKNATWAAGMSYQPKFTSEGLSGAIQVASEDTDDLKRVTTSLGDMRKAKTIHAAAHKDENPAQLERTIESNSTTNAFILGASRARIENDAAKVDDNNQAIIDTMFAASNFLPGPGKNVSDLWKKIADYGKNRSVDALKGETEEMFTGNLKGAKLTSEELKKQNKKNSADDSVLQLISLGVIGNEALKNVTLENSEGQSPIDSEGNFDFSKVDAKVRGDLWEKFIHSNPTGQPDSVNRGLSSGVANYEDAYNRGHG